MNEYMSIEEYKKIKGHWSENIQIDGKDVVMVAEERECILAHVNGNKLVKLPFAYKGQLTLQLTPAGIESVHEALKTTTSHGSRVDIKSIRLATHFGVCDMDLTSEECPMAYFSLFEARKMVTKYGPVAEEKAKYFRKMVIKVVEVMLRQFLAAESTRMKKFARAAGTS
jgi:hypothetical protein